MRVILSPPRGRATAAVSTMRPVRYASAACSVAATALDSIIMSLLKRRSVRPMSFVMRYLSRAVNTAQDTTSVCPEPAMAGDGGG